MTPKGSNSDEGFQESLLAEVLGKIGVMSDSQRVIVDLLLIKSNELVESGAITLLGFSNQGIVIHEAVIPIIRFRSLFYALYGNLLISQAGLLLLTVHLPSLYNIFMIGKPIYVRAVFFDVAGTLLRVRGSVGQIYWELAKPHGVRATPEAIEQAFLSAFAASPPLVFPGVRPGSIRAREKQWWYDLVSRVFHKVGGLERFDEYFESVFKIFSGSRGWELYPETEPVLTALRDRGLIIGVISNFDSRIYPVLSELGVFKLIDSVHISSRIGAAKPDGAIFEKALADHHLHPKEALHVGDSLVEDISGARAAGLWAVYLNRTGKPEPSEVPSIRTLIELLPTVQKL